MPSSYPHNLPPGVRLDDFEVKVHRADWQGVNQPGRAVRVTHLPTGLFRESCLYSSQHANRHEAFGALVDALFSMTQQERDAMTAKNAKNSPQSFADGDPNPSFLAAVNTLKGMGYTYQGGQLWKPPLGQPPYDRPTKAHPGPLTDDTIREVFLDAGLTIKEGEADLDPRFYVAARNLLACHRPAPLPALKDEALHWVLGGGTADALREMLVAGPSSSGVTLYVGWGKSTPGSYLYGLWAKNEHGPEKAAVLLSEMPEPAAAEGPSHD